MYGRPQEFKYGIFPKIFYQILRNTKGWDPGSGKNWDSVPGVNKTKDPGSLIGIHNTGST
jgi:hypothetical protein